MSDMSRSALEDGPDEDSQYLQFRCQSCNGTGRAPVLKFAPNPDVECPECLGETVIEVHRDDYDPEHQPGSHSWR